MPSPSRRSRKGEGEEIMTLFLKGLPEDAKEEDARDDIDRCAKVLRVMLWQRKDDRCNAFVRFGSVKDAEKAMYELRDGKRRVCGRKVQAEMARRNTEA
jgi:RNA recognition motif-containing protein